MLAERRLSAPRSADQSSRHVRRRQTLFSASRLTGGFEMHAAISRLPGVHLESAWGIQPSLRDLQLVCTAFPAMNRWERGAD